MKTNYWLIAALACVAALVVALLGHPSAGFALAALPVIPINPDIVELAEEFAKARDEIRQRQKDIEQAVVKGLKNGEFQSEAPQIDVEAIVEDPAFAAIRGGEKNSAREFKLPPIGLKALINLVTGDVTSTGSVYPTPADRLPGRLGQPLAPLRLIEVLPSRPVTSNKVEYIRVSGSGDAGVQVEEGDEKAEMDFEGELLTANVATIAVHTTASAQVLDDAASLQATIERVMRNKTLAKAEEQLMTGSGTSGYVDGLNTQATWLNTNQDGIPERIGQALTTMETAGYAPDVVLMHPNDWFAVSILKDADGNYIYGNPASPARPSLWNRPVITSPKVPEGTALVGDSSQVTVLDRMQPTVFISRDHKDYRTRNLVLILVEMRIGLELYDSHGFRKIDLGASG